MGTAGGRPTDRSAGPPPAERRPLLARASSTAAASRWRVVWFPLGGVAGVDAAEASSRSVSCASRVRGIVCANSTRVALLPSATSCCAAATAPRWCLTLISAYSACAGAPVTSSSAYIWSGVAMPSSPPAVVVLGPGGQRFTAIGDPLLQLLGLGTTRGDGAYRGQADTMRRRPWPTCGRRYQKWTGGRDSRARSVPPGRWSEER